MLKPLVLIFFIVTNCFVVESASAVTRTAHRKQRAAVISLPSSYFRWTQQVIVPVLAMINQTDTYLWFDFQMYHAMPTAGALNLLYHSFGKEKDRTGVDIDENFVEEQRANKERKAIYQYIESFFSNFGMNGAVCMQRAICEMSEAPLSSNGLLGKIVELILTPSTMKMPKQMEPFYGSNSTSREMDPELEFITAPVEDKYTEAYRRGKSGLCWSHYASCPINIFKMLNI